MKKILKVIVLIFIVYIVFSAIFFILNGHYWQQNLYNLKWNISNQSKFETKNFIIDLPKLNWIGEIKENGDIYLVGTVIYHDVFGSESNSSMPIVIIPFQDFNENAIYMLKNNVCDISFEKSTQTINNFEVDVYDCESSDATLSSKSIVYKNDGFLIYGYDDRFRTQYNKLFESVRLKE
jgi:hypothetical protein